MAEVKEKMVGFCMRLPFDHVTSSDDGATQHSLIFPEKKGLREYFTFVLPYEGEDIYEGSLYKRTSFGVVLKAMIRTYREQFGLEKTKQDFLFLFDEEDSNK